MCSSACSLATGRIARAGDGGISNWLFDPQQGIISPACRFLCDPSVGLWAILSKSYRCTKGEQSEQKQYFFHVNRILRFNGFDSILSSCLSIRLNTPQSCSRKKGHASPKWVIFSFYLY
jgi:hypothetical protein